MIYLHVCSSKPNYTFVYATLCNPSPNVFQELYSFSEQENSAYLQDLDREEPLNAVLAFWRGVNLMQNGRWVILSCL